MPLSSIIIGNRFRKDLGDVDALAKSINDLGLLHPVVVMPDGTLIAGQRRLEACKRLGWQEVPVNVVDLQNIVRGEHDENAVRKDFTITEAVAIGQAMEPAERQAAKERQGYEALSSENFSELKPGRALDKVASFVGMSRPTLQKAATLVQAAEAEPERFAPLVEQMDRTGKVSGAFREYRRIKDAETLADVPAPTGKYRTIVIDPPWDWGDENDVSQMGRSVPEYATMPIDQIEHLPVSDLADDNCHLYLWITNRSLPKGFRLIEAWGFRYIQVLTWCKPSIGIGNYFRNNTEHLLFGVKGSQRLLRFDVGTWFSAERGDQHSNKPRAAYDLIASCSPAPRLDMFARQQRDGFTVWGNGR